MAGTGTEAAAPKGLLSAYCAFGTGQDRVSLGQGLLFTIGRKGIFWYEIKLQTVNFFGNLSWMCHAHLLPPRVVSSSSSWQFIRGPTTLFVRSSFLVAATTVN